MIRHGLRLTSLLAGVAACGILATGAAQADVPPPSSSIPAPIPAPGPILLPAYFPCTLTWTNVVVGTDGPDVLFGTSGADLILGLGGDDYIYGDTGRDTIIGGDGDDVMDGAQGNDCVNGGAGDDWSVQHVATIPNGSDDSHSLAFRYDY